MNLGLIVGPPSTRGPMGYCPVCSAATGCQIVHDGPSCQVGKPAFGPELPGRYLEYFQGLGKDAYDEYLRVSLEQFQKDIQAALLDALSQPVANNPRDMSASLTKALDKWVIDQHVEGLAITVGKPDPNNLRSAVPIYITGPAWFMESFKDQGGEDGTTTEKA